MIKYRVKPKYAFCLEGYMRGELTVIEYRPQTMQCVMENEEGKRIIVTCEYMSECMERVLPQFDWSEVDDQLGKVFWGS